MKNINYLKNHKKTLLYLTPLVVFIAYIFIVSLHSKNNLPGNIYKITAPTKYIDQPQIINESTRNTNPPVKYDRAATDKIIKRLENRTPLSPTDLAVENRLIGTTNRKPLDIARTEDYSIQYLPSIDAYFVEIKSQDLNQVKRETHTWFLSQGFSQEALCIKPVFYYINWTIAQQLRPLNLTFNPAVDGC